MTHALNCPVYSNYQPPYEECTCGEDQRINEEKKEERRRMVVTVNHNNNTISIDDASFQFKNDGNFDGFKKFLSELFNSLSNANCFYGGFDLDFRYINDDSSTSEEW